MNTNALRDRLTSGWVYYCEGVRAPLSADCQHVRTAETRWLFDILVPLFALICDPYRKPIRRALVQMVQAINIARISVHVGTDDCHVVIAISVHTHIHYNT